MDSLEIRIQKEEKGHCSSHRRSQSLTSFQTRSARPIQGWEPSVDASSEDSGACLYRRSELAGAQGSREVQIGLQAAVDLDGGVTGANDALALAPGGESRHPLAEQRIEALNRPVIRAY
jgi:hypothetical protein